MLHRKLRLMVDELEITSFEISGSSRRGGTVRGHEQSEEGTCTTCWGDSRDCTENPMNAECFVSDVYCSEVEGCWVTQEQYGYYTC